MANPCGVGGPIHSTIGERERLTSGPGGEAHWNCDVTGRIEVQNVHEPRLSELIPNSGGTSLRPTQTHRADCAPTNALELVRLVDVASGLGSATAANFRRFQCTLPDDNSPI